MLHCIQNRAVAVKRVSLHALLLAVLAQSSCGGGSGSTKNAAPTSSPQTSHSPMVTATPEPTSTPRPSSTPEPSSPPDSISSQPNIMLIISDDQGLDASAQYSVSSDVPKTPTLDALAAGGIVFENAWATPACATTRGTLITGLHGINSGIDTVPDYLETSTDTLQKHMRSTDASKNYQTAVIGKWHLGGEEADHPNRVGVDYYAGNISNLSDYTNWPLTINGVQTNETRYNTSKLSDLAIAWIAEQNQPWFLWLAYSAPHSPFHLPPATLHERNLSGTESDIDTNPRNYYLAAIEAMDNEIGRILDSLSSEQRAGTLVIYVGDNGTPKRTLDTNAYIRPHSKGTLYEGGLRVPLVVSGAGVMRSNTRESALVNTVDIYATIAELVGANDVNIDGQSFVPLLSDASASHREYNYAEYVSADVSGWAVRDANFKLIEYADGAQEFYQLSNDRDERSNLIDQAATYQPQIQALENYAAQIRGTPSDGGGSDPTDITNAQLSETSQNCADYAKSYRSSVTDINRNMLFNGRLSISVSNGKCQFQTNAIPNHDFNDGSTAFPNAVSEQNDVFEITASPSIATSSTALSLNLDNALLLNGVKVDLLAAACYGVGDGKTGCNDVATPWRYDPMHTANGFRVDSHNAHTQPDGTYHYHGSPNALFAENNTDISPVIGFAADGFPIYGSFFNDGNSIRKAISSYRLKSGSRPSGAGEPGGNYDGRFRDDYEYVSGLGDLDECNGMSVNGIYAYYITDTFPYIIACFRGTPDDSFLKR